jgi:hypothetical protein
MGLKVEDVFAARMVALMKLIEADGLAAGGGLEPNPECNEPEGNVTVPNCVVVAIEFPPVTDL